MYILSRREQIDVIKKVLYKYEESLSDGYGWYICMDDDNKDEEVDETLTKIAEEILDEFHKEETRI